MLPSTTVSRLLKSCATPDGQLAYRLQALHLPQCRFDPLALLDLAKQLAVRGSKLWVRSDTRDSSSSFSRLHSYWRRRLRRLVCTTLTSVVG